MGNDGGVILKRKDLVRQSQTSTEDRLDSKVYNRGKWTTCALSNKPLEVPIVSDYRGNLFNKEAILEYLVDPDSFSSKQKELVSHITGLKDVVELNLQKDESTSTFVCPITGDELGKYGPSKSIYLVKCHDALSARTLEKTTKGSFGASRCPLCNTEYDTQDVIVLNPETESDIRGLEERIQILIKQNVSHSLKKVKKSKKKPLDGNKVSKPKTISTKPQK